jgi:hypothetical protein
MASDVKPKAAIRRVFNAFAVIALSLLAATYLGSTGSFSSGSWNGTAQPNWTYYGTGFIDASGGSLSGLCNVSTALNPNFVGGANAVANHGAQPVPTFWFLLSYHFGYYTCGSRQGAYGWGQQQAQNYLGAIYVYDISGFTGTVSTLMGDVEHVNGTDCATDDAGWACDNVGSSTDVIRGFEDYLNSHPIDSSSTGVYSSISNWQTITLSYSHLGDPAHTSDVDTSWMWFASWGADQTHLNNQATSFNSWGFNLYSWQYACGESNDQCQCSPQGCTYCQLTWQQAQNEEVSLLVNPPGLWVDYFDKWTNSQPNIVCGVNS